MGMIHRAPASRSSRSGVSLLEIALVAVIAGLLVGGFLMLQNAKSSAALRNLQADIAQITAATRNFHDKYSQLPGDMDDATKYWGTATGDCAKPAGTVDSKSGTCNGNGDGHIGEGFAVQTEVLRAWDHLARAGMYPGSWTGTASVAPHQSVAGDNPGVNLPVTRDIFDGDKQGPLPAAYRLMYANGSPGDFYEAASAGNYLYLAGRINACCGAPYVDGGVIRAADAYRLDTKLDDGRPDLGKVQIKNGYFAGCATSNASPAQYITNADKPGAGSCPLYIDIGIK